MLTEWLDVLISWVNANPTWTGVLVFLIAFSESLAVIGILVPGVVMMFAAGALIGAGVTGFWPIYWWAVAGAVLGDGLSFFLGHYYRHQLRGMWPVRNYQEALDRGVTFFHRWGGKSVAIGRFFGPVRAMIPLVAGMLEMPVGRFLLANILSALAWAVAYLLPGIAIGASLELASEVAFHLVILLISTVVLLWLLLWLLHRLFVWLQPVASSWIQRLLAFSAGESLPRRVAAALADPDHPEAKGLSIMAGMIVLSVFAVMLIMTTLFGATGFGNLDTVVQSYIASWRQPSTEGIMVLITTLGDSWLLGWLSLVIFGMLFAQHRPTAWHWLAAVAYAIAVPFLLKNGLQVSRPPGSASTNWSFPSAHTLHSTVVYGFLAVLLATRQREQLRWTLYAIAIALVVLIGVSRIYLGVHWFSDVFAGWMLGLLWIAVLGLAWRHHPHPPLQIKALLSSAAVVLVLALSWHLGVRQDQQVNYYRPVVEPVVISGEEWSVGAPLPLERPTLVAGEVLDLRFAGDIRQAAALLQASGWTVREPSRVIDLLQFLGTSQAFNALPVVPKIYAGSMPALILSQDITDQRRFVLRLWALDQRLGDCPVYAGHVVEERQDAWLGIMSRVRSAATSDSRSHQADAGGLLLEASSNCL